MVYQESLAEHLKMDGEELKQRFWDTAVAYFGRSLSAWW